jgi:hypothetical protein
MIPLSSIVSKGNPRPERTPHIQAHDAGVLHMIQYVIFCATLCRAAALADVR